MPELEPPSPAVTTSKECRRSTEHGEALSRPMPALLKVVLSQLLLHITEHMGLSAHAPCQPGKWKWVVVTFLTKQIKNATSQGLMAASPPVPPGPLEAPAMLRGWGNWRWPWDLALLCPQTLPFGWGCICCGGQQSCNEARVSAVSALWPPWHWPSLAERVRAVWPPYGAVWSQFWTWAPDLPLDF